MNSPEMPLFDDFDTITAAIEIEYVTEQLGVAEMIIRDYPKVTNTFNTFKDSILENPTNKYISDLKTRLMAEKKYPGLAAFLYDE